MSKKPKGAKPQGKPKGRPGGGGAGAKQKLAKAPKHKNVKPKKGGGAALQDVPLVGRGDDENGASDLELSDEDLEFVQKHSRRLGFLESLDKSELDKSIRAKQEKQAKQQAEERKRAAEAGGSEEGSEEEDAEGDAEDDEEDGDEDEEEEDDGAEAYERAPRRVQADKDKSGGGLPVKTLTGDLLFEKDAKAAAAAVAKKGRRGGSEPAVGMEAAVAAAAAVQVEGVTITDDMEAALAESKRKAREEAERRAKEERRKAAAAAKKAEESALPPALRGLDLHALDPPARRAKLQEVMAASAQKLLAVAGPEAAGAVAAELRTLQALVADADSMVSRLAMLSLLAVFKDILPGYRIRPPSDKEQEVKVSKDVAKLRDYEQALLKSYQAYLRSLLDAAQCVARRTGTLSHSRVAVRCLSGLLSGLPHFNYTSDILQAVVPRMASGDAETRSMACEAVGQLLSGGEGGDESGAGRAALEAVQLVADLIKRRKCVVPPEVVRTLAVLRFRDVIRAKAGEDQEEEGRRKKGKKAEKRDVKRRRKEDEVSRAFKEANAGPDQAELAKQQSLMLEALFEVYFRVLKHATSVGLSGPGGSARNAATVSAHNDDDLGPSSSSGGGGGGDAGPRVPSTSAALPWPRSKLLKKCPLLHPVLDGLAKYTHLISVDYMNDLMDVFGQLLAAPTLPLPERLRLLATTAAVLRGQGEALNVDRRDLYVQLYDTLLQVPLYPLLADDVLLSSSGPNNNHSQGQDGDAEVQEEEEEDEEAADAREFGLAAACEAAAAAAADAAAAAAAAAAGASEGHRSRRLPVGFGAAARSQAGLLAGVLEALLCEPKMADMQRAAAFVKRLAGAALQAGPGEAMALWAAAARLLRRYPKLANLLEYEGEAPTIGGRPYDAWVTDPSEAGGLACCLWEVALAGGGGMGSAGVHYHPHLAQAAHSLLGLRPAAAAAAMAQGGGSVTLTGPLGTPATIPELAEAYDASRGLLRPTPPLPAGAGKKGGGGGGGGGGKRLAAGVTAAAASLTPGFIQGLEELAAEYGDEGEWPDLVLDTDSDSEPARGEGEDEGEDEDRIGGGGDAATAAEALRRMWHESRRFLANQRLRRQKALEVEKLKRFQIHLHKAAAAAAAAGGQQGQAAAKVGQANGHAGKAAAGDKRRR
ncbi:hypothetical protein HYH02_003522 [Chlamydomonas schloesseri]|uniref:Nucleolar complex-associated protein 3 N-terminal domain-containing protein n=1 Tax=Chlamydomonas schloesseri TaxID=2026947 RepID=A0A835WQQ6_9CHLO|nr:hypothetical protein HYH02_003522 [Chlamydomonas schloesseri]|eukprot:KAG2451742.1 hypothetical protein HYH02_003522 [Chlamydomonas schloesseri]